MNEGGQHGENKEETKEPASQKSNPADGGTESQRESQTASQLYQTREVAPTGQGPWWYTCSDHQPQQFNTGVCVTVTGDFVSDDETKAELQKGQEGRPACAAKVDKGADEGKISQPMFYLPPPPPPAPRPPPPPPPAPRPPPPLPSQAGLKHADGKRKEKGRKK
jgi:hypothetical protein